MNDIDIIKCVIRGQRLSVNVPVMADLTVNYFNIMANFDSTWEAYPERYVHLHRADDSTVGGDWILDSENKVANTEGINLTAGEWEIWYHGAVVDPQTFETQSRITTEIKVIKVLPTGNEGGLMPIIPESNVEQITALAEEAVEIAQGVRDDADAGDFNGATFTPSVSTEGVISWTNDKGLPNPTSRNIKGQKGDTGEGVPSGGTQGQVIVKGSGDSVVWGDMPSPATTAPAMDDGTTGTVGTSTKYAREDHVHPHDSTIPQPSVTSPVMDEGTTGSVGTINKYAKADHKHPTDTSRAAKDLGLTDVHVGDLVRVASVSDGVPTSFNILRKIPQITTVADILTYDNTKTTIVGASWDGWGYLGRLTISCRPLQAHTSSDTIEGGTLWHDIQLIVGKRPPANTFVTVWQPYDRFVSAVMLYDGSIQFRADLSANQLVQLSVTYFFTH